MLDRGGGGGALGGGGVGEGVGLGVGTATHAVCATNPFVHVVGGHTSHTVAPAAAEYSFTPHARHCDGPSSTLVA